MAINVQDDRYRAMAKQTLDDLRSLAEFQEQGCIGMASVVEPDAREACLF